MYNLLLDRVGFAASGYCQKGHTVVHKIKVVLQHFLHFMVSQVVIIVHCLVEV